jgi:hypothetical protein
LTFEEVLTEVRGRIFEGTRARSQMIHAPIGALFILHSPERADKRYDSWIAKEISDRALKAENTVTKSVVQIPLKNLRLGLRRLSGVNVVDISDKLDFVVVGARFPKCENYFLGENVTRIKREMPQWRNYVEEKLSKLAVAFRFNISAPGTRLFAWYSARPMAGCGVVWNISGLNDDVAKILALWFNSTINALQIYLERVETEGAWMQLHKYVMDKLLVIHPSKLSRKHKGDLLRVFQEVSKIEFPSFIEQLKKKFPARVEIDKAVLRVLGFYEEEINLMINYLYPALAEEIDRVRSLMAG